MSEDERRLLLDAFDSNWIAPLGPHVDGFERELGAYVGMPYAAALSSGTAALHLGLMLVGVRPGDVVMCSTFTFAATANAIRYVGAEPVFVDSADETWCLDPNLLARAIASERAAGRRVAAVLSVDLYGLMPDYDAIEAVCAEADLPLVEDAAEALGTRRDDGRAAGSFGACAAFSFNGNKIITTSGGGMLVSRDADLVQRTRYLATQARDPVPHYQHQAIGYNYRLSNLLAAVGRGQLMHLDEKVTTRRAIRDRYGRAFAGLPGFRLMPEPTGLRSNAWLTCIEIDPDVAGVDREAVRLHLEADGIESRPLWKPMHQQPVFEGCRAYVDGVSDRLFERGLCLPSGSSLTEDDQQRVLARVLDTPGLRRTP
ncbi:MAG: aminotransferase class I/II-fold pyridoxal phosphate-dependent enzyme [Alphaproteobacteria bacterium]|nr:aminotransferase class I/II-fold pyridoxal phosphate-dependent enzyme [Alphaproteobacteria bacterium]